MLIELPASQVLELSGPEAVTFAQAQFASDVRALQTGHWQWSAWLSAQGRVRAWFALLRVAEDRLLLWLRGADAAALRADLSRYLFRSKLGVQIPDVRVYGADAQSTAAAVNDEPRENHLAQRGNVAALRMPGGERCVMIAIESRFSVEAEPAALAQWRLDDIRAGLPELVPALQDQLLPQWLGLERLGAISVAKGCYPGQEIMARLHFKGGNKRGLYRIAFSAAMLPEPGMLLRGAETDVGMIVAAVWADTGRAEALAALNAAAATGDLQADTAGTLHDIQVVSRFG